MRVGLEATFYDASTTGHGQYVRALSDHLRQDIPKVKVALLRPVGQPRAEHPQDKTVPTAQPPRLVSSVALQRLSWEQMGLSRAVREAGADLVHLPFASMYLLSPLRPRIPTVLTIHDMIPFIYPVYANSLTLRIYLTLAFRAGALADRIITSSENSARDISRILHIPLERINVIPLAADPACMVFDQGDSQLAAVRERYSIPGPFIYNVGGMDIRKNLTALLQAFAAARPSLPDETHLVVSGDAHTDDPQRYPDLKQLADELRIAPWVIFTGRVTDAEKVALLNAASVYVYPSLYEGFGLSPLEAMSCGAPVIAANLSSLPEVVGQGGILVEPEPRLLAEAIVAVINDSDLNRRLRQSSLERAKQFSWRRTVQETAAVYAEAITTSRSRRGYR